MLIRRATVEDAAALCSLHRAAIGSAASHYDAQQLAAWSGNRTPELYCRPILEKLVLVAEIEGTVQGFAQLDHHAGVIEAVYVTPASMRRGVGRRLLGQLEAHALGYGLAVLTLDASLNAVPFYAAAGYEALSIGDHQLSLGVSIQCMVMRKSLAPSLDGNSSPDADRHAG